MSLVVHLDGVDDADDGRVDRAILHTGRHPRRAAADDEDSLAEARIDGIDGNEVVAVRLAGWVDWTRDEQFVADETLVFARSDDRPYDFREDQAKPGGFAPPDPPTRSLAVVILH